MSGHEVKTGLWHDHSNSGALSASLTLDIRTGLLLIAGLATFITVVGGRFWAVIAFLIYQWRKTADKRDGIHHQQQAIYRNSSTPVGVIWLMMRILWAWRNSANRNILRLIAFASPPLLCFVAFAASSLLSARVAAPSYMASKVRMSSKDCGFIDFRQQELASQNQVQETIDYSVWSNRRTREATNYARSCGGNRSSTLTSCNVFPVKSLPYTISTNTPCPFKRERCLLVGDNAVQMETDWLNSHRHFGINAAPSNRIIFRKVTSCSVLKIDDLTGVSRAIGSNVFDYYLGPRAAGKAGSTSSEFTYRYFDSARFSGLGYSLRADKALVMDPLRSLGWDPIPDLNRTDADVSLFILNSNNMRYATQVRDPFFSANTPVTIENTTLFQSDSVTSAMACTDQFQIQNPNNNKATTLTSSIRAVLEANTIGLNNIQTYTIIRLGLGSYDALLFNSVNGINAAALLAQDSTYFLLSPGLPDNQWQLEVQAWFETSLAMLQDQVIMVASKNADELRSIAKVLSAAEAPKELRDMCDNQMLRNIGGYQTFSVLGIGLIIGLGLFIATVSWCMEIIAVRIYNPSVIEQWRGSSVLHIQRLAILKDHPEIDWAKLDGDIPIIVGKPTFASPGGSNSS